MKPFITLILLTLFGQQIVYAAAAPTVTSSNLVYSNPEGAQLSGTFTAGNGTSRIIVLKAGSPVTGLPVNGVEYTANSAFGTAGAAFTAPDEFVIGKTGWINFSATKLLPGVTYHIAVFEYNGTGTGTQYLMVPLAGTLTTVTAPVTQASAITATATTGNTITLSWTKGSGMGRAVVARKGVAVDASPVDLSYYAPDANFGTGTKLGTDNYIVYKGIGNTIEVKNLEPNTTYHFAIFEYNGSNTPVHLVPGASYLSTTKAGPDKAPTSPSFSFVEGNSMTISVVAGNGARRLFIAKKGSAVTAAPVNGVAYTANGAFGTPGTAIAPNEFVVGTTTNNFVSVTNLEANTIYHFSVYEYDADIAGNTWYLTSSFASRSGSTATTPATPTSNLQMVSLTGSAATINFTSGNGGFRMAVMKAGSAVDATPANYTKYTGNVNFGSGAQVSPNNYCVVAAMNGNQFTVSNLQPGVTYHTAVFEFNGSSAPVYATSAGTFSFTVPIEPTVAAKNPSVQLVEGRSLRLVWTVGNGARRIVVAKKGSAVTAKPADLTVYTANENFGQGTALTTGEYIVYDGTANNTDITNLDHSSTYHFAVFEYNAGADNKPDYLVSSYLATSFATASAPTTQPVIGAVSNLQATQATLNFTKGNGAYTLFVMKQGAAVNVLPTDAVKYNYSLAFGGPTSLISDGNFVVYHPANSGQFTVSNLLPNTTYHISALEYNGFNEPVYLRTGVPVSSFTTPDVPGATVPTVPATAGLTSNVDGNKFTLNWTNGNGQKRIVVMKQGAAVSFIPASATGYAANASFGAGTDLGNGQYVVYNGAASTVDITNLQPATIYHFTVFEYNGTGATLRYLTAQSLSVQASTVAAPATPVSVLQATPGNGSLALQWTNGNGSGRLVVMKEATGVLAVPAALSVYPANAVFKNGSQLAAGEYVVYAGNGNQVTVTGLEANKMYHFRIFEYNGITAPVYNVTHVSAGAATVASSLPIKLKYFRAMEKDGAVLISWATTMEANNAFFTIERSSDGVRYTDVKTIKGAGNSHQPIEYNYTDKLSVTGKIYYRLKQTDIDGRSTWSPIQVVDPRRDKTEIHVYPNPTRAGFTINLPVENKEGLLFVYNATGVLVSRQKIVTGQYITSAGWKAGTYYLTIRAGEHQYNQVMIKQ